VVNKRVYMTRARERYEAKTRVVTFRVTKEVFNQIEEVKAAGGLSYGDLIKLGAGIASEEIRAKIAEASGLEARLSQLKAAIGQAQQKLEEALAEERKRRLAELDLEIGAYKLFDEGWGLEEVAFKLGIPCEIAYRYLEEWGRVRNEKVTIERELLRQCLRRHIHELKRRASWYRLFPGHTDTLKRIEEEVDYCQYLLDSPSEINDEWRAFLLAEYASQIESTKGR
jgi:hypothetical protein